MCLEFLAKNSTFLLNHIKIQPKIHCYFELSQESDPADCKAQSKQKSSNCHFEWQRNISSHKILRYRSV
ncbi:hypothetical protein DMC01_04095 [Campylobacter troglodytis]|nr:hypothetical protein DMC01_04095 [Campylobacter troglodytis]